MHLSCTCSALRAGAALEHCFASRASQSWVAALQHLHCMRAHRFDLLHVMIDEPNDAMDYQIASHIVGVHMRCDGAFAVPFDMRQLQRYLKYARTFRPEMTVEARPRPAVSECCLFYVLYILYQAMLSSLNNVMQARLQACHPVKEALSDFSSGGTACSQEHR